MCQLHEYQATELKIGKKGMFFFHAYIDLLAKCLMNLRVFAQALAYSCQISINLIQHVLL